jgi:hypothetical protein
MSKGDRDGRGFRHHKKCPSLNCDRCVNGRAKKPFRQALRRLGRLMEREALKSFR